MCVFRFHIKLWPRWMLVVGKGGGGRLRKDDEAREEDEGDRCRCE